jgi:hypothetical protein
MSEGTKCPAHGCDHTECVEQQYLRSQLTYWKNRAEGAEESLRLTTDEGMRAW